VQEPGTEVFLQCRNVTAGGGTRQLELVGGARKRAAVCHLGEDAHGKQLVHCSIVPNIEIECNGYVSLFAQWIGVSSPSSQEDPVMFSRKIPLLSFSAAVGVALIGSLALTVTVLVDAVLGMQSFL
jgi:hypothetical protein